MNSPDTLERVLVENGAARLATRLAFLVAGFGVSCWAPLVPFAKARLAADEQTLGMLLLCLGIGSVIAMLFTGILSTRFGTRPVIVVSGVALALLLPTLVVSSSVVTMAVSLFFFGAALGALEVAMNVHAVEVERDARRPLMSGFHALYSVGGFAGATFITTLLSLDVGTLVSVLIASGLMLLAIFTAWPRLLKTKAAEEAPHFGVPRGVVAVISALAAIMFLAEGALLDWGALLITGRNLMDMEHGGTGYMMFAIAMTAGRFSGDALIARIGDRAALLWGGLMAIGGFTVLLLAPIAALALVGFVLIGLGAANIVPVLFRRAGSQTVMPAGLAVAIMSTAGYAGILLGPAIIGFVAKQIGLTNAFWMLPVMVCLVPISSRLVTRRD
ncbi:MAG TPA: MFS transporter [Povalibacter sp.]|nr:MFS transporter [Povalibacter sp.]